MSAMSEYRVGEVARISGVSVRTLHHYHDVGLLVPSGRSESGYRMYSTEDLQRLQQILYYRELDFRLDGIAEMLAGSGAPAEDHLRRQHRLLRERLARTRELIAAIENEMEVRRMGLSLTPEEQLEVFGTDKLEEYGREAEQRWGSTDAWRESQRRAAAYTKEDWITIKGEGDANVVAFAAALADGLPPTSPAAMALAEAHRDHISRWFYECPYAQHRGLATMYLADPRFTRTYDEVAPGLARYIHDAIVANADNRDGS
jgi:MerR family transcriptional regulator, thiopeptide resistance regulator